MANTALAILLLPALAFVLIVFVTKRLPVLSSFIAVIAIGIAAVLAVLVVFPAVLGGATTSLDFNWLRLLPQGTTTGANEPFLRLGIAVDPLTAIMLVVVTVVSFLVHVYSRG